MCLLVSACQTVPTTRELAQLCPNYLVAVGRVHLISDKIYSIEFERVLVGIESRRTVEASIVAHGTLFEGMSHRMLLEAEDGRYRLVQTLRRDFQAPLADYCRTGQVSMELITAD